jgi:hypothetical protein
MRSRAVAVVVVLSGCGSGEVKPERRPDDLFYVEQACRQLKAKIAAVTFEPRVAGEKPAIQILAIRNETDTSFDTTRIGDQVRSMLLETGKLAVLAERAAGPGDEQASADPDTARPVATYTLTGKVSSRRMASAEKKELNIRYHFEIHDKRTRTIVVTSDTELQQ